MTTRGSRMFGRGRRAAVWEPVGRVMALAALLLGAATTGCTLYEKVQINGDPGSPLVPPPPTDPIAEPSQPVAPPPSGFCAGQTGLPPLVEDRGVYAADDLRLLTVQVTVPDLSAMDAVNADAPGAKADAIFQADGYPAPDLAFTNATIELRGKSTRHAQQKSYKIKLDKGQADWRDERTIHLNKHPNDLTRVRNKLSFDHFQLVPDFTSLRTQFVHLFMNGADMGLYTQVENVGSRFLAHHGLPDGTLYKAQNFAFAPIRAAVAADPAALEAVIEAQANPDLDKLLRMIRDVNDLEMPIDQVIAEHFNRENYLTWLAVQLLVGNFDTITQNFYLYSPTGCEGWYFLPWDYDGAWSHDGQIDTTQRFRWQFGPANWWSPALHRRFFMEPANLRAVEAKMSELAATVFTEARTRALLDGYREVVRPIVEARPDIDRLPDGHAVDDAETIARRDAEYDRLPSVVPGFVQEYQVTVLRPMPFWIRSERAGDRVLFHWTPSFDLQGDALSYELQIAVDSSFAPGTFVMQQLGIPPVEEAGLISWSIRAPARGTYQWRVVARAAGDPAERWQVPFGEGFLALTID